ncbi:zinc finger CCCH domain-containing protein 3 [Anopheles bellator]|uniref:zinc finger CCCH domain-containing protein 3 n=1 Tax=Anopheles bellator TaxID=139047 RepID=UPI0026491E9B|nr:zinc finger CCCH domain-containing protein 3 [Anopheles bellator]
MQQQTLLQPHPIAEPKGTNLEANSTRMKQQQSATASEQPSKIFINPKFAKAHINPKFLATQESLRPPVPETVVPAQGTIHLNPAFLERLRMQQVPGSSATASPVTTIASALASSSFAPQCSISKAPSLVANKITYSGPVNPIIKNTRRKLIRAIPVTSASLKAPSSAPTLAPLVKIGKNKLIRSTVPRNVGLESVKAASLIPQRKYLKIDRRVPKRLSSGKPSFVKRYALSRVNSITAKRVVITDPKLLKLTRKGVTKPGATTRGPLPYTSSNKRLVLVNINGVLYRSTPNTLQKSVPSSLSQRTQGQHVVPELARKGKEHFLVIRGTRFALDRTGMRLRMVGSAGPVPEKRPPETRMHRIDIGGLTYKARQDGTFVRTDVHRTRNHLSVAKQRSIQVLATRLKKCNEPCHIYRRLGKCLAHSRGKCPKLHDPKHISICRKFLRGECTVEGCLMSHNVSLEKMPVCRYFLEGRCVRDVCPYLHKKVSEKERICHAFLNGFCALAGKCPNRHVFQCPEYERDGKCDRIKCPYPHGRKEIKSKPSIQSAPSEKSRKGTVPSKQPETIGPPPVLPLRYYREEAADRETTAQTGELSVSERNQLKRMLGEVDQMKLRHAVSDGTPDDGSVSIAREAVDIPPVGEPSVAGGNGEEESEEDIRPLVLRRKKLGTLPSFIPI